ncbi:Ankyrin repeat-containing protein [Oryctes borbonicus]|uniref:Ankyrin repeat-containing protein n=1 Tax=Oryctes borbonicus TaxID=1629725 RepID=A0A0T6B1S4_9SCAR|nr:Ankyrin repeat-containing protein [Oryctes borbonicus]
MEEQKLLKRKRKALSENNKNSLITACISLADHYFTEGKYGSAIAEYEILAAQYKASNKSLDYARSQRMIGEAYCNLRQYSKALKYQKTYLTIAVEKQNNLEEQRAHATIGHTYLTKYDDTQNIPDLYLADKSFKKSLAVCERLTGISQREHMDMKARLYANLALVEEYLGHYEKAIELVQKSIVICKAHDILEQLERGYTILGSIYNKKADYKNAIAQYNLAIEVASRLEDKANLISAVLLAKGEIFIKLSDFTSAKSALLKAYKMKNTNGNDAETIERTLKIVAAMTYIEERLLNVDNNDFETKKHLYEKMGDGAASLKIFSKAAGYYQKMLQAAKDNQDLEESMGSCYFSLAQTYFDDNQYEKALEFFEKHYQVYRNDLKESTNSLLSIAVIMDIIGRNSDDIEKQYEQAIILCTQANDNQLKGKIISKYIKYLQKYKLDSKVEQLQEELDKIAYYTPSDTESDGTDIPTTSNIGEDINIDDITDVSDGENNSPKTRGPRIRNKSMLMRKNHKGETQLHVACINGNTAVVQQLLERGHLVNVRDNCGWLPIHEACNYGHLEIIKLLVEKGATVNDRGGIKCDGVTPLHDAASNGHLEVVEYLMDKGALLIAKKDNGETPFHCLKNWKKSVESIDPITQTYYETISKRMMEALERSGHDKDVVMEEDASNAALVLESNQVVTNKRKKDINYSLSSSDDELMQIDKNSSDECTSDADSGSNATEHYQKVMKSLRYRTFKKEKKCILKQNVPKRPALLGPEEVGDDWLQDDVGRTKKRKTFNIYTSTSSRRNTDQISSSRAQTESDFKENHAPSHSKIKKKKRQTSLISAGFSAERSPSPLYTDQTLTSQSNRAQKSKHQMTLSSFCDDQKVAEADSTTVSPKTQKTIVKKRSSDMLMRSEINDILSVDVRINGKLYRVPVPYASRNTLTIKWLADEAAKRFCRKEGMTPVLELETKNGAVLAEDDNVSILFPLGVTLAEEINATVVKWNVPSFIQRYKEACNALNIAENSKLSRLVSETSTILDLSNHNFGCKILEPLCKAINRQTNIHHLDLSGNSILNGYIELLCAALPSLENLSALNLSMNLITSDGLHYIANIFTSQSEIGILENLTNLDLSFNPLGNESLRHLAIITRHLKLHILKLIDVDFTSEIFDEFSNRNVELYLDYLEELDVSENTMDKDDLLKFILWIRPANLQVLNVSNNNVTECGLIVETVRIFEANSTPFWKFKHFNFSRCKITDVEVYELLRLLSGAENFVTLNLSYNEDLSSISLRRLLDHDHTIKELYLEGCVNILKYFEVTEEVKWRLNEGSKIKDLRLSIDRQKDLTNYNGIVNMWKDKYYDRSQVVSTKHFLELSAR